MNLRKALVYTLFLCPLLAAAQVPVSLAPVAQQQFLDANGNPLAFGCVYTYQSGTTTGLATYADYTGLVQNPNPIVLSASGAANIWLQAGQLYTIQVISAGGDATCSLGTTMYTVDGVGGGTSTTTTSVATSTTPTFNVIASIQLFKLTITANTVSLPVTFTNVQSPAVITFQITQDGVGGHTFAWPTNVTGGGAIDTTANHTTTQSFVWNGTTILPIGNAFTSVGNSALIGTIYSTNTFTGPQTFTGGISVTGGAVADTVTTPVLRSTGNGTALAISSAAGSSGNTAGGALTITGGAGIGSGAGGEVDITAGNAPGAGAGGNVVITAGTNGSSVQSVIQLHGLYTHLQRLSNAYGTAQSNGNVGLTGWGAGATSTITGTDTLFRVTATAGTGPSANPTIQVTFADGSYGSLPGAYCFANRTDAASPTGYWTTTPTGVTNTSTTLTFVGTPVAASVYSADVLCIKTVGTF